MRAARAVFFALFLAASCGSTPEPGTERGDCYPNGTCNDGLSCLSDLCVQVGTDGGSSTDGGAADGGGGAGVCGDSSYQLPPDLAECVNNECCTDFDPCLADSVCRTCLTDPTDCDANSLFTAVLGCVSNRCPSNFCGSSVTAGGVTDTVGCAQCVNASCCTDLDTCLGGPGEPDLMPCLDCLGDPASPECTGVSSVIQTAAVDFMACYATCGVECS